MSITSDLLYSPLSEQNISFDNSSSFQSSFPSSTNTSTDTVQTSCSSMLSPIPEQELHQIAKQSAQEWRRKVQQKMVDVKKQVDEKIKMWKGISKEQRKSVHARRSRMRKKLVKEWLLQQNEILWEKHTQFNKEEEILNKQFSLTTQHTNNDSNESTQQFDPSILVVQHDNYRTEQLLQSGGFFPRENEWSVSSEIDVYTECECGCGCLSGCNDWHV